MKNTVPALLVGAVIGVAATWVALKHNVSESPAEEKGAGLVSAINPDTASIVKQIAAVGLTTALPGTAQLAPEAKAYGRVLDPTPLIALVGDVAAAEPAAQASANDYTRTKALHDQNSNASLQAVESAQAAMQRDQAQLAFANARLVAGWGTALAKRSGLRDLVGSLASGDAALVRIDLLPGETLVPKSVRVSPSSGEPSWRDLELLGPMPTTDQQSGGTSWLALWKTSPLRPGAALLAILTGAGAPQSVLVVPRNAIVRHQGGNFVYVQSSEHGFERRLVTLGSSLPEGTVVTDGVKATDKVVVTGAQQMLSTEVMGSAPSED